MFYCLIIEDDYTFGMNVKIQVQEMGIKVVGIVSSINGIEEALAQNHIDLILSDIKLEDSQYSYDFFSNKALNIPIIFFSAYKEEEIYEKSQKVKPYIFLTKPFDKITLKSAVHGALREKMDALEKGGDIQRTDQLTFIRNKGKLIPIKPTDILYIHSEGNYCYLILKKKKIAIRSSLKNILEKLNLETIIQVHRAYMINIPFVENLDIGKNELRIKDTIIPIGRKYKKDLIDRMKD